jgi:hypothetical protein
VNDELVRSLALLNSHHVSCERKRQKAEKVNNEISRLETVVSRFRNNKEGYLKIKQTVEEQVRSVLTDSKVFLELLLHQ